MAKTPSRWQSIEDRIAERSKLNPNTGCVEWTGCCNQYGYGIVSYQGRNTVIHRVVYELRVGPIPDGLDIDHLCRNRKCINPQHMEPVTKGENIRRSPIIGKYKIFWTHCPRGHELSGDNLRIVKSGKRLCVTCRRKNDRERKKALRDAAKVA